eukprot:Seg1723.2 transcript_id=Seg1723.2/GoldUCD/mRNA.D3Y31 product=Aurelin protein_id=Seg1723.2/GoldUCD/D3Y31
MKIILAATLMLSIVCIYGRRMPTQKEFDDELMKAFEDETVYDAQTIPSSEEASLDAFPSEQDKSDSIADDVLINLPGPVEEGYLEAAQFKRSPCANKASDYICNLFSNHCQGTGANGLRMRTNCKKRCGLC